MLSFLAPSYIKQAKLYIKGAEKKVAYNRDRWNAETLGEFQIAIEKLKAATRERNKAAIETIEEEIEALCRTYCPPPKNAGMCENVEVFLVAIVIALGIRSYILQPFTIPTSSMFPTLNGITGKRMEQEPPNALVQAVEFATKGRSYFNVIAKDDERIVRVTEEKRARFFTYTKLETDKGNTYWIHENRQAVLKEIFPVPEGYPPDAGLQTSYKKGQPIARGYFDTGDHVFVDKMSYHFRKPTRGEVFVFTTGGIDRIESQYTQYYIKRLAGTPGDKLRIAPPELFINDQPAQEPGFVKVMTGHHPNPSGYQGYSNTVGSTLRKPSDEITLPEKSYFALGDNSYYSSDSRAWGFVPGENLVGAGVFVYWPFLRDTGTHFGLIK